MDSKNNKIVTIGSSTAQLIKILKEKALLNCEFISIDSDEQLMMQCYADKKLIIGSDGIGFACDFEQGNISAKLAKDKIKELFSNAHNLILVSCLGGGFGSGALPIITKIANELKINMHIIVSVPYLFEGKKRTFNSINSIAQTKDFYDDIIIINSDDLLKNIDRYTTFEQAYNAVHTAVIDKIIDLYNQ